MRRRIRQQIRRARARTIMEESAGPLLRPAFSQQYPAARETASERGEGADGADPEVVDQHRAAVVAAGARHGEAAVARQQARRRADHLLLAGPQRGRAGLDGLALL